MLSELLPSEISLSFSKFTLRRLLCFELRRRAAEEETPAEIGLLISEIGAVASFSDLAGVCRSSEIDIPAKEACRP